MQSQEVPQVQYPQPLNQQTSQQNDVYDEEVNAHKRPGLVKAATCPIRCCCRTATGCLWCFVITVILLAGLGVLLYFIFRVPDISDIQLNPRRDQNGQGPVVVVSASPLNLNLLLNATAKISSQSIVQYKVDTVQVDVFLKIDSSTNQNIGGGSQSLTIPAMASTNISIPLTLSVTGDTSSPVLGVILRSCGFLGQAASRIPLFYTIKITAFGIIKNLQVYQSDYNLDCPNLSSGLLSQFGG